MRPLTSRSCSVGATSAAAKLQREICDKFVTIADGADLLTLRPTASASMTEGGIEAAHASARSGPLQYTGTRRHRAHAWHSQRSRFRERLAVLIAVATPDVFPYSKTGGLGDVSAALPEALTLIGHEVVVFSPYYRQTREYFAANSHDPLTPLLAGNVWIGDEQLELSFLIRNAGSLTHVFCVNDALFDRPSLYTATDGRGYPDNAARYSSLPRGAGLFDLQG
jgi:hypothetical protein